MKIRCTLGIKNFFIPQFTVINAPIYSSKTQPTSNWQVHNDLCFSFSNWEMKKLRRIDNTITHWSMPLDSFCAIYNREEHSLALYTGIKEGVATHCILLSREPYILALLRGGMALLRGGCNVLPLLFLFLQSPLIQDFHCAFANPCML